MELSELLKKYISVIEKLASTSGETEKVDQIKTNLISAAYLNFATLAGEDSTVKPLLGNTPSAQLTLEEFEAKVNEFQSTMKMPSFGITENLQKAMRQTLEDYISELETKLPDSKGQELRNLVSTNL